MGSQAFGVSLPVVEPGVVVVLGARSGALGTAPRSSSLAGSAEPCGGQQEPGSIGANGLTVAGGGVNGVSTVAVLVTGLMPHELPVVVGVSGLIASRSEEHTSELQSPLNLVC